MWPLILLAGAYLVIGHVLKAKAPHVFGDAPSIPKPPIVKPAGDKMSTQASAFDPNYPLTGVYKSDPDKVVLSPRKAVQVSPDGFMTAPLFDPVSQLDARLDYKDAHKAMARLGFRLISREEWENLYRRAHEGDDSVLELAPVTLVHTTDDQYHMRSLGFQKKHDAGVAAQLADKPNAATAIELNNGKQWLDDNGVQPGMSVNYGWEDKPGHVIQSPGHAHEATYTDYSQKTQGRKV